MEHSTANPAVDLLHHFASNLSGIRLEVDLGSLDGRYPDPSFFRAIQRTCGSDAVYRRFCDILLDFERGLKARQPASAQAVQLVMDQATGPYHNLEFIQGLVEAFFPPNSVLACQKKLKTALELDSRTPPYPSNVLDGFQSDVTAANSESTATISSCFDSAGMDCEETCSCRCHDWTRRSMPGYGDNTCAGSLEQEIFALLIKGASLGLSKHILGFFHQARTKLRNENSHLKFLKILDSFHEGLIDDYELLVLAYSCIREAENEMRASRGGSVAQRDLVMNGNLSASTELTFRSRTQVEDSRLAIESSIADKNLRLLAAPAAIDARVLEPSQCELASRYVTFPHAENRTDTNTVCASPSCDASMERVTETGDSSMWTQCALCDESVRESAECINLMNRLDFIYSAHDLSCQCSPMVSPRLQRREGVCHTNLLVSNDQSAVVGQAELGSRVAMADTVGKPKGKKKKRKTILLSTVETKAKGQRTIRSRKPTARLLESLQTS